MSDRKKKNLRIADGVVIYGLTDKFYSDTTPIASSSPPNYTSSPALGPRAVTVNRDGTKWMSGWTLNDLDFYVISQFPNVTGALNIGSVHFDPNRDVIYAQMGEVNSRPRS